MISHPTSQPETGSRTADTGRRWHVCQLCPPSSADADVAPVAESSLTLNNCCARGAIPFDIGLAPKATKSLDGTSSAADSGRFRMAPLLHQV